MPPVSLAVPPHAGPLGREGSVAELSPAGVRLIALKPAEDGRGVVGRLQETAGRAATPTLRVADWTYTLHPIPAHGLATYRLLRGTARRIGISELD